MIQCTDQSLYTGISNHVSQRMQQHQTGTGAKFFRSRTPDQLVYLETVDNRSVASKRELAIKKLKRPQKLALIASSQNELHI